MRSRKQFHTVSMNEKCMWVFIVLRWSRKLWSSVKINVAGLPLLKKKLSENKYQPENPSKNPAMGHCYFTLQFCRAMLLILMD